jgi:sterol desaturase/sphingolipid hydroxylase (fatty acid hydroxylase superfamily)
MDTKLILIVTTVALIFTLESVFPHYRGRAARVRHAVPHFITAIMNGILTRFLLAGLTIAALAWAESNSVGLARVLSLPAAANLVLVFLLFDIWMYFWHMANHRFGFFWRFHRAHHSDTEMDTTTALRFHPGELVLSTFFRMPVVILIGMSFTQLVLFEVLLNVSTLFHHSNLAVPEKWDRMLRTVIVTPNMHRVHHSVELSETNSNFTSLLSVWDRLFRSFRTRKDTHTITIGLPSFRETKYQRLWGFLITPLR